MTALRIAWAGPWNTSSAIAEFGTEIVAGLISRGHAVEVLRTEVGEAVDLPCRPSPAPLHAPGAIAPTDLRREFDAVVVNLGDYHLFHGAGVALLQEVPATVVLHDAYLTDLYIGWAQASGIPLNTNVLRDLYNEVESGDAFSLPLREMAARRPLIEWVAGMACGAVVHARHYEQRVRASCPGPVEVIPLALSFPDLPPPPAAGPILRVATIGHVNPNKRADEVLKGLAASPTLRERVQYSLIGPVDPTERARLEQLAAAIGAPVPVFTGWVTDAELRRLLAEVDVISCLRDPVLEGGSASLILAMRSGRPTLVSDQGGYADLPNGLVLRCAPGHEAADVSRHLEAVLHDQVAARAMAERARQYAETHFSANHYVESLLPLLHRAAEAAPGLRTAWAFGRSMAELGVAPRDPAAVRIAGAMSELFSNKPL